MNANHAPATVTDSQIRTLRDEATMAGDLEQVLLCFVALGWPIVDVLADGQPVAGETFVDVEAADRRCNWLDANRPGVLHTSRVRETASRDEARAKCVEAILAASAMVEDEDRCPECGAAVLWGAGPSCSAGCEW